MSAVNICSGRFDIKNANKLEIALQNNAYKSVDRAISIGKENLLKLVEESELRGKGGGGGLTGHKWRICDAKLKFLNLENAYLVVNGDESEPGTFKDKYILGLDPHLLIEGIIIASIALSVKTAYIYIRGEYFLEFQRMQEALDEAKNAKIIGKNAKYPLEIHLYKGAGAYICGEKSALLNSLEGKRGMPRLKGPKTEPDYLYNIPCVVNNVETIASLPFIINNGADAYKILGTSKSAGGMIFGASGCVNNPCIKEVGFGMDMMEYINTYNGGVKGNLKAIIPGGSSCPVLTKDEAYSANLSYESLSELRSYLGTGGMIVLNDEVCMVEALYNLIDFYEEESCGQCTPCREGSYMAFKSIKNIYEHKGKIADLDLLLDISNYINGTTVCVFAPALSDVISSFVNKFRDEFVSYIKRG